MPETISTRFASPVFQVGPDSGDSLDLPVTVEWQNPSPETERTEDAARAASPPQNALLWRTAEERQRDDALATVPRNMSLVPSFVEPTVLMSHAEIGRPLDERLWLLTAPRSPQAEAYRLLRHRLLARGDPRLILVTSAVLGEGKTTCAANLALAMAEESTASVLLLDANLRRPALRRLFGISHFDGVLDGSEIRTYPIVALAGVGLRLASAANDPGTSARIDRAELRLAIADLAFAYDYLVIDAPSVLESSEANLLAEVVDGVVLTMRAGASRRRHLRDAIARLEATTILGAVLVGSQR